MRQFWFLLLLGGFFLGCKNEKTPTATEATTKATPFQKVAGETMWTTYHITYEDSEQRNLKPEIDTLLVEVNQSLSTYIKSAFISQFNQAEKTWTVNTNAPLDRHFWINFLKSKSVWKNSKGAFDPTVMPLANYWGFGYTKKEAVLVPDSSQVDSLRQLVGLDKIVSQKNKDGNVTLQKAYPGIELDFSAIAKGYGVDVVGELLESKGIKNYMVEIGGEVRTRGVNQEKIAWQLAISEPRPEANPASYVAIASLKNKAMATSGNYRNFHLVDGVPYGHTINPKTGYPEINRLLSATVFANDCMTADAYATASMTLGLDEAFALVNSLGNIEACFFYSEPDGSIASKMTDGAKHFVTEEQRENN